jgi:hypothetical protein
MWPRSKPHLVRRCPLHNRRNPNAMSATGSASDDFFVDAESQKHWQIQWHNFSTDW